MCRRCVWKDHSLKTGFWNVSPTNWKKWKITTGFDFWYNQKAGVKFSLKTFSITETKENKAIVFGDCWSLSEVSEEKKQQFFRHVGRLLFWLHLDEHGLHSSRKNTEGCSDLYACGVEETEKQTGKGKAYGRGDWRKGSEKWELEEDMIRVSLVINLSEAVRTFFKSPKFTFQKLPLNP